MSKLENVTRGKLKEAIRYMFIGVESVGKTSLVAAHPSNPILFDCEGGSAHVDIARYQFGDGNAGHIPKTFEDVLDGISDLMDSDHSYGALAIDTVDALEALIWDHVCKQAGVANIDDIGGGFGKGVSQALTAGWRILAARLDQLRLHKNMDTILVGHTHVKTYANPTGDDYDRFSMRIQDAKTTTAAGFLRGWVDVHGFMMFEGITKKERGDKNAIGIETGRRLIQFRRTAAWDAKTRIAIPETVEYVHGGDVWSKMKPVEKSPDELVAAISGELTRLNDDELAEKVNLAVNAAQGDAVKLNGYLASLMAR